MKLAARMAIKPGEVLAQDVEYQGEVIFKADTVLDDHIIKRLARYSIMAVMIKEPVDFAKTRYEKLQYDENFKSFEKKYNEMLLYFKKKMNRFVDTRVKISEEELLKIYYDMAEYIPSGATLLDYLYTMLPNEDELTYNQLLSSALLAGAFADWLSMNEEGRKTMILCGFYYDIGKLTLPYQLLWKPEKLTDFEFDMIKSHPVVGYDMVKHQNLSQAVKNCVLMHHEKIDGSGYPYHLSGDAIDKYTRYIMIVDAYIAMASPRSYRKALTPLQILGNFERDIDKFDAELLLPIMKRIADAQIGNHVTLSDGTQWEIFIIHPQKFSRPLLKNDNNEFLDLMEYPNLDFA